MFATSSTAFAADSCAQQPYGSRCDVSGFGLDQDQTKATDEAKANAASKCASKAIRTKHMDIEPSWEVLDPSHPEYGGTWTVFVDTQCW